MQSLDRVRSMTESERKSCVELRGELSTPLEHEERGRERKKDAKSVGLSDTGKSHCPLVCHPRLRRGRSWSSIDSYGTRKRGRFGKVISKVHIYMVERIRSCGRSCCDYCAFSKSFILSLSFSRSKTSFDELSENWSIVGFHRSSIIRVSPWEQASF